MKRGESHDVTSAGTIGSERSVALASALERAGVQRAHHLGFAARIMKRYVRDLASLVEHGLAYLAAKGEYATVIGDSEFLKANADGSSLPSVRVRTWCVAVPGRVYEHVSWLDLSPRATATPAAVRAAASLESITKKMT